MAPTPPAPKLADLASQVGLDWIEAPYFRAAEADTEQQWSGIILPFLQPTMTELDFSTTLDLAAGHGRHSERLLPWRKTLHVVDIRPENIAACQARFGAQPGICYHVTDGYTLPVPDASISFLFCFDAMVHFDSDVVRAYLGEIRRALRPGGHAFLHHSNDDRSPGGDFRRHPAWRNFLSLRLMAHYALKEGLEVVRQQPLDWTHDSTDCDGLTLLQRPIEG